MNFRFLSFNGLPSIKHGYYALVVQFYTDTDIIYTRFSDYFFSVTQLNACVHKYLYNNKNNDVCLLSIHIMFVDLQ